MKEDTPAQRAYSVRLALGDGWKVPLPMAAFAALLSKQPGAGRYDSSVVSRLESGARKLTLVDAAAYAAVDPLKRGRAWVAWGPAVAEEEARPLLDPSRDRRLTEAEIQRARDVVAAERAGKTAAKKRGGRSA